MNTEIRNSADLEIEQKVTETANKIQQVKKKLGSLEDLGKEVTSGVNSSVTTVNLAHLDLRSIKVLLSVIVALVYLIVSTVKSIQSIYSGSADFKTLITLIEALANNTSNVRT